jgi:hypothetical protein
LNAKLSYSWKKNSSAEEDRIENQSMVQEEEKKELKDRFPFKNDIFMISPGSGEIWPKAQVKMKVTFFPQFEKLYDVVAYCDIGGKEKRIPLNIKVLFIQNHSK